MKVKRLKTLTFGCTKIEISAHKDNIVFLFLSKKNLKFRGTCFPVPRGATNPKNQIAFEVDSSQNVIRESNHAK